MANHSETAQERVGFGMERILFFSDAVFAIAITLLALEIRLPETEHKLGDVELRAALEYLIPEYIAFVISFWVIGAFWMGHHRKFQFIKAYDGTLMRINLFLLMAVAFVPFTTSVLSRGQSRTAVVLYACSMMVVGLLSALLSWHALRTPALIVPGMSARDRRQMQREPLQAVAVFALSILIAQWNPEYAEWSWLLMIPVNRNASRRVFTKDADGTPPLPA